MTIRDRLALLAIDFIGVVFEVAKFVRFHVSSVFTVWCDPFGYSRALIPLLGRDVPYRHFIVAMGRPGGQRGLALWSRSLADDYYLERDRRIVAWFYRTYESPQASDWKDCVTRFGLDHVPTHYLSLCSAPGMPSQLLRHVTAHYLTLGGDATVGVGSHVLRVSVSLRGDNGGELLTQFHAEDHQRGAFVIEARRTIGIGTLSPGRMVGEAVKAARASYSQIVGFKQ